jgi:hypothetical protein
MLKPVTLLFLVVKLPLQIVNGPSQIMVDLLQPLVFVFNIYKVLDLVSNT